MATEGGRWLEHLKGGHGHDFHGAGAPGRSSTQVLVAANQALRGMLTITDRGGRIRCVLLGSQSPCHDTMIDRAESRKRMGASPCP